MSEDWRNKCANLKRKVKRIRGIHSLKQEQNWEDRPFLKNGRRADVLVKKREPNSSRVSPRTWFGNLLRRRVGWGTVWESPELPMLHSNCQDDNHQEGGQCYARSCIVLQIDRQKKIGFPGRRESRMFKYKVRAVDRADVLGYTLHIILIIVKSSVLFLTKYLFYFYDRHVCKWECVDHNKTRVLLLWAQQYWQTNIRFHNSSLNLFIEKLKININTKVGETMNWSSLALSQFRHLTF